MRKTLGVIAFAMALAMMMPAGSGLAGGAAVRKAAMNGEHRSFFQGEGEADASGTARLKLYPRAGMICYDLRYEDITVFHIDIRKMKDRELVQELYHRRPTDDRLAHCRRDIEPSIVRAIKKQPKTFYIFASEYRGGAIAGTIRRP